MSPRIVAVLQSLTVICICGLVGLSLAKVSGADSSGLVWTSLGGMLIGAIGIAFGPLVRAPAKEFEMSRSPLALLGLRIATVSFIVAIGGWLIAVFLAPGVGWLIGFVAAITGVAGILIHNVNVVRGTK